MRQLPLGAKFTLTLLAVFVAGAAICLAVLAQTLEKRAEAEVASRGLNLMQMMNAVRAYTSKNIQPLLPTRTDSRNRFIRETIPAFSARSVFAEVQENPEYRSLAYKEASLNPSNPSDRADPFEQALVQRFRGDRATKEISGFRTLNGQSVFYSARPLTVTDPSCLVCHSDPAVAPKPMLAVYGTRNGFHWKLNDPITAQVVYVPAGDVLGAARRSIAVVMAIFLGIFGLALIASNALLRRLVVGPVTVMARVAGRVGRNEFTADGPDAAALERVARRGDELGLSARVFRTMASQVLSRERALTRQVAELRIEIDQERRAREVGEVVQSEYFRDLQAKARQMRQKRAGEPEGG